jgi:hypothetical protein
MSSDYRVNLYLVQRPWYIENQDVTKRRLLLYNQNNRFGKSFL